nr:hypothetical protein [uncultured Fluviicola sp.]
MKFSIEYGNTNEQRILTYDLEECSFNMQPIVNNIDFELIINKLSLSVLNKKIIQLWGFCGLAENMESFYNLPDYKKGTLIVEENLEYGFAYSINDDMDYEYPVQFNSRTGWVCIGSPEKKGVGVEFITNCVAIINENNELVSLWLKPERLPMFDNHRL